MQEKLIQILVTGFFFLFSFRDCISLYFVGSVCKKSYDTDLCDSFFLFSSGDCISLYFVGSVGKKIERLESDQQNTKSHVKVVENTVLKLQGTHTRRTT